MKKPPIGRHKSRAAEHRSRRDKAIGGIGVHVVDRRRLDADVAGDRNLTDAQIHDGLAPTANWTVQRNASAPLEHRGFPKCNRGHEYAVHRERRIDALARRLADFAVGL